MQSFWNTLKYVGQSFKYAIANNFLSYPALVVDLRAEQLYCKVAASKR